MKQKPRDEPQARSADAPSPVIPSYAAPLHPTIKSPRLRDYIPDTRRAEGAGEPILIVVRGCVFSRLRHDPRRNKVDERPQCLRL